MFANLMASADEDITSRGPKRTHSETRTRPRGRVRLKPNPLFQTLLGADNSITSSTLN